MKEKILIKIKALEAKIKFIQDLNKPDAILQIVKIDNSK